jgi:ATP-dependent DNA helicase DinG
MLTDDLKKTIQTAYSTILENKGLNSRYGQRLMIAELARTLVSGEADTDGYRVGESPICVVEAGTGTGKTIAYAVSAIPVAQALEKTLVIATATVALQEQIVYKDLPDIQRHSGLTFSFSLAKGRGRYLCLTKLDGIFQDKQANQETVALYPDEMQASVDGSLMATYEHMLTELSSARWDGDKDNWPEELDASAWGRVTTDHAQCTGRRCANIGQCSFYKAREEIGKVDVIVTNHDLVLADLSLGGGVILPAPEDTIYIFDEGHHLPDKAINHFSQFSRIHSTERWLDQGRQLIAKAAPELGDRGGIDRHLQVLPPVMETLKQQLGMMFNSLEEIISFEADQRRGLPTHRFEQGIVPENLRIQSAELAKGFQQMVDALDQSCSLLEEAMESSDHSIAKADAESWYPGLAMLKGRAEANYALWNDYSYDGGVEDPPRGRWVAVVEAAGGSLDFEVSSSPILAANTLTRYLWRRCFAAVVTSATLTALGRFDRFMLHAGTPKTANYAVVPSPFNFFEAGELVVPAMSSEPGDAEAHTSELIDLLPEILAEDEGSLVLFSSRRQMENVFEGLPAVWQQRIMMQGGYSKQETLKRHREVIDKGEGSVLFGLASFAEGVDLPGKYCSHVVIAKIPFAVPDQPVESALAEWIESRGGNSFMDISVPEAALKLVQASGRLLRTETDTGRVTILDRRLVSKRYGQAILDSLPPFKRKLAP